MINNIIWKTIPKEILNNILEYDGKIKYRNGKFINQICKDDERFPLLQSIPSKIYKLCYISGTEETFVYFNNKDFCIGFIETKNKITNSSNFVSRVYRIGFVCDSTSLPETIESIHYLFRPNMTYIKYIYK